METRSRMTQKKSQVEEEEDGIEESELGEEKDNKTIVLHIGSQNLRIGLASNKTPTTVPMVIARKMRAPFAQERCLLKDICHVNEDGNVAFDSEFDSNLKLLDSELKSWLKAQKKRSVPNGTQLVKNYNKISKPETVPPDDDPEKPDWIHFEQDDHVDVICGKEAFLLPLNEYPEYKLFYPIKSGVFNESDYASSQQLLADIYEIFKYSITSLLQIPVSQLSQYSVIFIVPDLYDRVYVEKILDILFFDLHFGKAAIVQESLCTSFGAGMSAACVVDMGAQKTSISCVEEGVVVPNSRIKINYGGDDITLLFMKLLMRSHFPYQDIDLKTPYDWSLANALKIKYCGLSEATYNVQLNSFFSRTPDKGTRKFTFKSLDETMLAPLGFFRPDIFENENKLHDRYTLFPVPVDVYDNQPNNPESLAQTTLLQISTPISNIKANGKDDEEKKEESDLVTPSVKFKPPRVVYCGSLAAPEIKNEKLIYPLDDAINQSIFSACDGNLSDEKAKNLYSSILIVGGAGQFPGFAHLLEERIHSKRANIPTISVIPPPRSMDAQFVAWKGACIYNRIRIVSELWIKNSDWKMLGSRVLQYKTLGYFWTG